MMLSAFFNYNLWSVLNQFKHFQNSKREKSEKKWEEVRRKCRVEVEVLVCEKTVVL